MYYKIFRPEPEIPDSWNTCHLWQAQCLIASCIAGHDQAFRKMKNSNELKKEVLRSLDEMVSYLDTKKKKYFPDEEFEKTIRKGLPGYIDSEAEHILKYISETDSLEPVPVKEAIIASQKNDPGFLEYCIRSAERFKTEK